MFENVELLEFGTGTGEHSLSYLEWGALCTFVEMNVHACKRAEKIFSFFAPDQAQYKIQNKSLFDFRSTRKYDIVVSMGVIHHTADKEEAFDVKSQYLKKGGFLILGIGNSAGMFQRNLQRAILYRLADNEEQIVSLANELFSEFLDRAEKYGRRSRKSIIYDNLVNPKDNHPSTSEVLEWFSKNNLNLYSAWPPIIPAVLGDPADRSPLPYEELKSVLSIPEIIFLTHSDDDIDYLRIFEKEVSTAKMGVNDLAQMLNDVMPDTQLDLGEMKKKINSLLGAKWQINPYTQYISMLKQLLKETSNVLDLLEAGRIEDLKKCIYDSKVLFRGTSGVGMNWYVGYKA
jgi:SAM-dependent methyltransferase